MTAKKEAFIEIFENHIGIILKIAKAYTDISQDTEDLVNDIAFEMWKSYEKFRSESKVSTWIYRVALNTAMNYNRKRKKDGIFHNNNLTNSLSSQVYTYQEENNTEVREVLYDCINQLSEINKAIILLYLEDKSYSEIATITGISMSNVGTRMTRIKKQIKKLAN